MSYEPTQWKDGDLVTSAKLNKLEQGVAGNVLTVSIIFDDPSALSTGHLNKTWQEIHDASLLLFVADMPIPEEAPLGSEWRAFYYVDSIMANPGGNPYGITFFDNRFNQYIAVASSPNDYPTFTQS